MATFPTLTPSSRTFTPGRHPHSEISTLNGLQTRVRTSNVILEQQLRLTFVGLTEAEMLSIRSHYIGQQGRFLSFAIPSSLLSGMTTPAYFTPTGYSWIYGSAPQVEDIPCAQRYNVSVELVTVPPEGANVNGAEFDVIASISAGSGSVAAEVAGASFTVAASLSSGIVADNTSEGLAITVPATFVGGTADPGASGDPYFSSVKHLLHMDGANNSTAYVNSSTSGLNISVTGVAQSTTQFKFGSASTLFNGSDYLILPSAQVTQYNFGTGDWTVELWLYLETHTGVRRQVTQWFDSNGTAQAGIAITASNTVGIVNFGGTQTSGSTVPTLNTWHHIALTRASANHRVFLNGVQQGGTYTNNYSQPNSQMYVGVNTSGSSLLGSAGNNAYIDELRITAGIARYTTTFSPPTAPFPDS